LWFPVVLGVLPSISVTSPSFVCGCCRCVTFGPVHRHIAVVDEHPFLGQWFELPLRLLLEVVVVVVLPVPNFSFVGVVRFVNRRWFGILVRFGSPLIERV
jgi:hypothetical protein